MRPGRWARTVLLALSCGGCRPGSAQVVIVGCLQALPAIASEPAAAGTSGSVAAGPAAAPVRYVLTEIQTGGPVLNEPSGAPVERETGASGARPEAARGGALYLESRGVDLEGHVGQQVEVTGYLDERATDITGVSTEPGLGRAPRAPLPGAPYTTPGAQRLEVTSVRMLQSACPLR